MRKSELALLPTNLLILLSKQKQNQSESFDKMVRFVLSNRFVFYPTHVLCGMCYDEEEIVRSCSFEALSLRLTLKEELFEVNRLFDVLSSMDLDLVFPVSTLGKSKVVRDLATLCVFKHLDERGYFKEDDHKLLKKKGKDFYDEY